MRTLLLSALVLFGVDRAIQAQEKKETIKADGWEISLGGSQVNSTSIQVMLYLTNTSKNPISLPKMVKDKAWFDGRAADKSSPAAACILKDEAGVSLHSVSFGNINDESLNYEVAPGKIGWLFVEFPRPLLSEEYTMNLPSSLLGTSKDVTWKLHSRDVIAAKSSKPAK